MRNVQLSCSALVFAAFAAAPTSSAQKLNRYGNPEKLRPAPTAAGITERDLQIRLYQFADDSMQGRQVGRIGNKKGTDYLAAEAKKLGLIPAGDNGTYFQVLPFHLHQYTNHSRLTANGNPLTWNDEWIAVPGTRAPRPITNVEVIFGGVTGDTTTQISAAQAAGKLVVLLPAPPQVAGGGRGGRGFGGGQAPSRFADAVALATVDLDALSPAQRAAINIPTVARQTPFPTGAAQFGGPTPAVGAPVDSLALARRQLAAFAPQAVLRITRGAAAKLFNRSTIDGLTPGLVRSSVSAALDFIELPSDWARNVVAIIPGSDPTVKHEYVAVGAHNDHVGITPTAVDKDSLKAFNDVRVRMLIAKQMIALTPAELSTIRVNMDSIRRLVPKARLDSINNGADDDGSGSIAVLEMAEAIQAMRVKPKRSTLFVWHTGEEGGLVGSRYFTLNPTVPLDSVVAQINIDMIGRGRAEDLPGGGPDYLGVVGSFFDSKDIGDLVVDVNKKRKVPLDLDNKYDTTLTWTGYNNIYGRSDHINYARAGVPIAFFFTGLHGDYHQRSDEAEFIDYPHYAKITSYIRDVVLEIANGPRPRINGSRPARPPKPIVP